MTDDLVKRLRYDENEFLDSICGEAADRIEELEKALDRAKEETLLLDCLRRCGVNNWEWYGDAIDLYEQKLKGETE